MTSAKYSSLACLDLRTYLWQQLQSAGLMDINNYYADGFDQPIIPIIPSQQIPEMNNSLPGLPYIVYDYQVMPIQTDWWIIHEVFQLMTVSPNHNEINMINNFIVDLFRRYDDSAKDVFNAGSQIISDNFDFKYTSVHDVYSPTPFKNEGGLMVGHVDIIYCYVRKVDSLGRF